MYDPNLLPELIMASNALNETQKNLLVEKLPKLSETKRRKLFDVFANEQRVRRRLNKKQIDINTEYLRKKTMLVNNYNEDLEKINEKNIMGDLDSELEDAFATFDPQQG